MDIEAVSFAYPARRDVAIFSNLNLHIMAGQTVALVGASGSGKSTVIQLLQRFYDPAAGTIRVDGTDIRSLSLEWYRNNVRPALTARKFCLHAVPRNISCMPHSIQTFLCFVAALVRGCSNSHILHGARCSRSPVHWHQGILLLCLVPRFHAPVLIIIPAGSIHLLSSAVIRIQANFWYTCGWSSEA